MERPERPKRSCKTLKPIERLLRIASQADASEGIRQRLDQVKRAACAQHGKLSNHSGGPVRYLVRLAGRALRDMEAIYDFVEADISESAAAWFYGIFPDGL